MGRSAKFHKRQDKKKTSSAGSTQPAAVPHPKPQPKAAAVMAAAPTPKEQKKRAGLKDKARASARRREGGSGDGGPVLGGADYVELMLGGRRRAAAEAVKLPKDPDA